MLNAITIRRRTELRRARTGALLVLILSAAVATSALCGGLWFHCLPVVPLTALALPVARYARARARSLSDVLRMLGA